MPSSTAGDANEPIDRTLSTPPPIHYRPHRDPRSSHQQIAALVRELAAGGYTPVLDVGAAQGMLGHMLEGSGIEIDAVEPSEQWAAMARPHYRQVWCSTIEAAPLPDSTYRLVVCGDVLEHLVDPVQVLQQLRRFAAYDAKFVISLPNVAHIAIRTLLLFGKFPRMERGILDKTHLHFFTRKTSEQMLHRAGLRVERASVTGVPVDELWKGGEGSMLFNGLVSSQHLLLKLMPGLFGYQWIFVASARS